MITNYGERWVDAEPRKATAQEVADTCYLALFNFDQGITQETDPCDFQQPTEAPGATRSEPSIASESGLRWPLTR